MRKHLTFLCWALFSIFLLGAFPNCQSGTEKNTSDTTTVVDPEDTTIILKTVRMDSAMFKTIFKTDQLDNEIKMLHFGLRQINGTSIYGLTAEPVKDDGNSVGGGKLYDIPEVENAPELNVATKPNYIQLLTRGTIKAYLGIRTGTDVPITAAQFNKLGSVWLVPCRMTDSNGDTLVFYNIVAPGTANACDTGRPSPARAAAGTNPSPPGQPCLNECDQPGYSIFTLKQILQSLK